MGGKLTFAAQGTSVSNAQETAARKKYTADGQTRKPVTANELGQLPEVFYKCK
ncbi:MAG: hypothetical protein ACI807_002092 [Paracoccaceae bacterium]|jgi:hypothetical protein